MKKLLIFTLIAVLSFSLVACGDSEKALKDGTYTVESSKDDRGGYAEIVLTVKDSEIDSVKYTTFDGKGNVKDENYGKDSGNDEFYKKAQLAVEGMKSYEQQINEKKQLELVDVVSGATVSFDQFNEAMNLALEEARK